MLSITFPMVGNNLIFPIHYHIIMVNDIPLVNSWQVHILESTKKTLWTHAFTIDVSPMVNINDSPFPPQAVVDAFGIRSMLDCACGDATWQGDLVTVEVTMEVTMEVPEKEWGDTWRKSIKIHTLWWTYKKLLKMTIEIVDFPINNSDFP